MDEKKSLLSKDKESLNDDFVDGQQPPSYDAVIRAPQQLYTQETEVNVAPVATTVGPNPGRFVTCRVCQSSINLSGKTDQFVVKCTMCKEATPIQNAPPGKKYVRCPCNCLLVCKISSQRIACPRPDCKRVINLAVSPITPPATGQHSGMRRVSCKHCSDTFLFNTLTNALARCPHCRKVSSVGPEFARGRGNIFLIIGFVLLIAWLVLLFCTSSNRSALVYFAYAVVFLMALAAFGRGLYYYTMKVSTIID